MKLNINMVVNQCLKEVILSILIYLMQVIMQFVWCPICLLELILKENIKMNEKVMKNVLAKRRKIGSMRMHKKNKSVFFDYGQQRKRCQKLQEKVYLKL